MYMYIYIYIEVRNENITKDWYKNFIISISIQKKI